MPTNFIRRQIDDDLASGKHANIVTRFPPEPNGYLHIGHAKSICLNFGIARDYGGECTLRFDDTNPAREEAAFAEAIAEDVHWLGFAESRIAHASDYFAQLYDYAVQLIEKGLAFVDSQSAEEIRRGRGTLTEPGVASPYRDRGVAENLDLFARMKAGEFADGEAVLRAKIDMASPNLHLRDPVLYRILHRAHQRTGDEWCIYPLYDFAHGQSDAIEGVTHSICTMEFEDNRALYDWFLDNINTPSRPRQIEFSRLNLNYTVTSKRLLTQLVDGGDVTGWDDPRMPTICGLRRRGFTPASVRSFVDSVGVTRKENVIDMGVLENCLREELDPVAPRRMAVLRPLKVVIENYPAGESEVIEAANHPRDERQGTRKLTLSREVYIDADDFMDDENPPRKYFRLAPGKAVRLRYAFVVRCVSVVRDDAGAPVELRCEYDETTRGGAQPATGKVKGIIHWVNAADAVAIEARLYDRLFVTANPLADKDGDLRAHLNPRSLTVCANAVAEASLVNPPLIKGAGGIAVTPPQQTRYQFERLGYFTEDREASAAAGKPVFNRIVTLRDSWAKIAAAFTPP